MQAQSARQYDPELLNKLALSQLAAEELIKREIKCPVCGFYLMDVYGRDHHITRVKCRKCKFNEVMLESDGNGQIVSEENGQS